MKRRYPLESLRWMRRRAVDERALEVAEQARRTQQAKERAAAADRAVKGEQARTREVERAERERIEQGGARVGDLQQAASFSVGAAERVSKAEERERRERDRAAEQARAEAVARGELASADAEAKAVDKHREGWQRELDARVEAEQEEAAGEVWEARRRRSEPGKR
jgi:hypothetical protein